MSNVYDKIEEYKLGQYVFPQYDDLTSDMIRPAIHLRPEFRENLTYALDRDSKQRPTIKRYYIDGVKVMEKYWTINDIPDGSGLMLDRKVEVAHVRTDGSMGDKFTLFYHQYDLTNPTDLDDVMEERAKSRKFIISTLKGQLLSILKILHPTETQAEIENWGASFFQVHAADLSSYYEANPSLFIAAVNTDTTHTWLDDVVSPGVTVRSMIVGAVL